MLYTSTRNKAVRVTASKAITDGLSPDGGLYLPEEIPALTLSDIGELAGQSYSQRAVKILSLYLSDFTEEELSACVKGAYGEGKFMSDAPSLDINTIKV